MILFLFGEDTYCLREKIQSIKKQFHEKDPCGMNFVEFDADAFRIASFSEAVRAQPFMAKSRLVVAGEVFSYSASDRDALYEFLTEQKSSSSNVIVLWHSGIPDKRTKLFRLLKKSVKTQEFQFLQGSALRAAVEQLANVKGVVFQQGVLEYFIGLTGSNLWQVASSLQTLGQYSSEEITKDDVDQFVVGEYSSTIFEALEALATRNKTRALQLLHEQISQGQHPLYILTMIVTHFRQLLVLSDLQNRGIHSRDLQILSKLHPFVVQKLQPALRRFPLPFLQKAYGKLCSIDEKVKTGEVSPLVAIDLFVVSVG